MVYYKENKAASRGNGLLKQSNMCYQIPSSNKLCSSGTIKGEEDTKEVYFLVTLLMRSFAISVIFI